MCNNGDKNIRKQMLVVLILLLGLGINTPESEKAEVSAEPKVKAEVHLEKEGREDVEAKAVEEKPKLTWRDNPNNCDLKTQWVRKDNLECKQRKVVQQAQVAVSACGPQSPGKIYQVLVNSGVPRLSAIQLLGSWKTESGLDHCQRRGDNGIAWGLNSWHPGRRHDMPTGLTEQILWGVHTEMPRDCQSCYEQFMRAESVWSIRDAIQRSTRWGHQGNRWHYANQFATKF